MASYSADKVVRVTDVRLSASEESKTIVAVPQGPSVAAYINIAATSMSDQNTVFQLNNIADLTCRDSRLVLKGKFWTVFTVSNSSSTTAYTLINDDNFGLKTRPLARGMSTLQHTINQATYTARLNQVISELDRLNALPSDIDFYENTQPDIVDSYSNATGSNISPLGPYTKSIQGDGICKPRSINWRIISGSNSVAASASNAQIVVECELYEPLCSPFCNVSERQRRGLYAITGETVQITWVPDLTQMIAFFNQQSSLTVSNVQTTFINPVAGGYDMTLRCIYLTPYTNMLPEIPRESIYPYTDFNSIFTTPIGSVAAGQSVNLTSVLATFTNVPDLVLIYARMNDQYRGCNSTTAYTSLPDKYLAVQSLSLQFDNGLFTFTSALPDQIYDVSKRNGLQMPRAAFKQAQLNPGPVAAGNPRPVYGCGSIIVVCPALDLSIREGASSASAGRFVFQAQGTFANLTETSWPGGYLQVVGLASAALKRIGNQYQNGLLSVPVDVLATAKELPQMEHEAYRRARDADGFLSAGGGIGDWFKKAAKFIAPHAEDALKYAMQNPDKVLNAAQNAVSLLKGGGHGGSSPFAPPMYGQNVNPPLPQGMFYM